MVMKKNKTRYSVRGGRGGGEVRKGFALLVALSRNLNGMREQPRR